VNAVIFHTHKGVIYEWLEVTATFGMSRQEVEVQLTDTSSALYGYQYASRTLFKDLLQSYSPWDGLSGHHGNPTVIEGMLNFLDDFGLSSNTAPGNGYDTLYNTVDGYAVYYAGDRSSAGMYGSDNECGTINDSCYSFQSVSFNDAGDFTMASQIADLGWSSIHPEPSLYNNNDSQTNIGSYLVKILAPIPSDKNWVCNNDSWDNPECWGPITGQPLDGDDVYLTQTDAVDRIVTFLNSIIPVLNLNSLTINATGGGTMTLSQSQDSLSAVTEYIGYDGTGTFTHTGGNNTVNDFYLGYLETGDGTYNLSGTGSLLSDREIISSGGNGTFNQTGGTNTANYIRIASSPVNLGATGTYNLSGGSLSVAYMTIASSLGDNGVFNQSGGSVVVSKDLNVAANYDASGTYNLSEGSLEVGHALGFVYNDNSAPVGVFNQTGGTVTADQVLSTWFGFTYNLDGGSLTTNTIDLHANANFTQTDGVNTVSDTLTLDNYDNWLPKSGSHYTLTDGTLHAENIVIRGDSAFTQTGGTNTVSNNLSIVTAEGLCCDENEEYTISDFGEYTLAGGVLDATNITVESGNVFNFDGGTLAVNTFNGDLVNKGGTLAPGSSPGKTQINGNYTQASDGILEVEIGGLKQGVEYDWLNITGNATLDGALDVDLFDLKSGTFTLGEGDVFDILSAESITGEFDLLTLAALDGRLEWDVSYLTDFSGTTDLVRLTVINTNILPTAHAGKDQMLSEGVVVNLDGSASTDSDGTIASYSWTQTGGTTITLNGAGTATPSFTAPDVTTDEDLTFSLVVTDNDGGSSSADSIKITVLNVNTLPVANAGKDQVVSEGKEVKLDGSLSSDSDDGSIASYSWTQTAGTSVVLSGKKTETPSFTVPSAISDTVLQFSLMVTDNDGDTDTALVSIKVTDALVVDAGADQQITEGDIVQLNGLNSLGVNSNIVSYLWTQTEGPKVILDDSTSATPSFIAPAVDDTTLLVFKLIVSDSNGLQDHDTTFINVRDALLTGIAPPLDIQLIDTVASNNQLYQFDTVSDPFFDSTDVQWNQLYGPAITLSDDNTAVPSFMTPTMSIDSTSTFEVRSGNSSGLIVRANVSVNILGPDSVNQAPTANAGTDHVVTEGDTVYLNGAASTDDGDIVGYYWQQTGGPVVMLSSIIQAQPSFVAPAIAAVDDGTELTFELMVTDDGGFVDRQSVTITILDNAITNFADDVMAIVSSNGEPIGIQTVNNGSLVALDTVDPQTISDNANRPSSLPYGLLDYSLRVEPGATIQVSFVLPSPMGPDFTWWKYVNGSGWLDYSANTTFNAVRDVVTITLTDNGIGDDDPTPGVIRDPGGLALVSASSTGGSSTSGGGGGGSTDPLLLVFLLLGFIARTLAGLHYYRVNAFPTRLIGKVSKVRVKY